MKTVHLLKIHGRKAWALVLLATVLFLPGCGSEAAFVVPEAEPLPEPEGLRIAVASDLHLDPDNTERGEEVYAVQFSP